MIRRRIQSFGYAFRGVWELLRTQPNARIHLTATAVVVGAGVYFSIEPLEWATLSLAMGLVWAFEAVNTALEYTLDHLHPERHPKVGRAKDLAAAAVLLASFAAVGVAVAVFGPRLWN